MQKSDAITLFETGAGLARAVGLTRGRISQWPDVLTQKQADLVMGAAVRLGKIPPDHHSPPCAEKEPGMDFGECGGRRQEDCRRDCGEPEEAV